MSGEWQVGHLFPISVVSAGFSILTGFFFPSVTSTSLESGGDLIQIPEKKEQTLRILLISRLDRTANGVFKDNSDTKIE